MDSVRFTTRIKIHNNNPYVLVNAERAQLLMAGWKKPMPVLVQVNNKPDVPWKINMMPIGNGSYYLYLHGDVRKASNTKVGDMVKIVVLFDANYRTGPMHDMPVWFATPLTQNPKAKKAWDALIPSRKKEILRYLSWLKSDEARKRNVQKALYVLSGKTGRFMARSWKDGK